MSSVSDKSYLATGYFPLLYCEGVPGCLYRGFYPYETEIEAGYMGYLIWRDLFWASYPATQIYVAFATNIFEYVAR